MDADKLWLRLASYLCCRGELAEHKEKHTGDKGQHAALARKLVALDAQLAVGRRPARGNTLRYMAGAAHWL